MKKDKEAVSNRRARLEYYEIISYKQKRRCAEMITKES